MSALNEKDFAIVKEALDLLGQETDLTERVADDARRALSRIKGSREEKPHYGHVLDLIGEAHRDKDHVALFILGDDGSSCIQLCPRAGVGDFGATEDVARAAVRYLLGELHSGTTLAMSVLSLLQIVQHEVKKYVAEDEGTDE